jgi:tRNA(Arg) A34 adenosine deaminase TadA
MGEGSEWIEASGGNCFGSCQTHHVGISPQEDRGGAAGEVGEGEGGEEESGVELPTRGEKMIPPTYKPKKKFMQLAIAEAKRARDRGDYAIGAVITRLTGKREVVIASAGNRVKTSGSSIKHVELETLKYVSSGYGRYLPDFVLYSTHEPCAMCAGACVWSKIGAVVFGVSQEDITAYGKKHGTEEFKWRACLETWVDVTSPLQCAVKGTL